VKGKTKDKLTVDEKIRTVKLVPPVFLNFKDSKGNVITAAGPGETVTVEGLYFGDRVPKISLLVDGKLVKCKTDKKSFVYRNFKNKPSPMDPESGESMLNVILPLNIPKGAFPFILDNKIGIATTPYIDDDNKGDMPVLIIE
jgi:hypothetical protein